ncbi:GntR family transcriptional regulator [Bacillus carboniphilus]|uniref:GntR family transcriptional regulator n=1 Tax=Bacillus carboniphilus TaxID=86663 RepID=A0ABY9JTP2_9BACI|nr:GntR family transcriptional regulator [Bacillus carboniphilus]WLR41792.1 GntR family transcriptional regulator [Bacillus carboniphilus]
MFELDVRSRTPIYEQLVEQIKGLIVRQVLKPDEQLPSVRLLSKELTVNPNTIQKSYRELEREGYIYSVKGKGSFVAPHYEELNELLKNEMAEKLRNFFIEGFYIGWTEEDILTIYYEAKEELRKGAEVND